MEHVMPNCNLAAQNPPSTLTQQIQAIAVRLQHTCMQQGCDVQTACKTVMAETPQSKSVQAQLHGEANKIGRLEKRIARAKDVIHKSSQAWQAYMDKAQQRVQADYITFQQAIASAQQDLAAAQHDLHHQQLETQTLINRVMTSASISPLRPFPFPIQAPMDIDQGVGVPWVQAATPVPPAQQNVAVAQEQMLAPSSYAGGLPLLADPHGPLPPPVPPPVTVDTTHVPQGIEPPAYAGMPGPPTTHYVGLQHTATPPAVAAAHAPGPPPAHTHPGIWQPPSEDQCSFARTQLQHQLLQQAQRLDVTPPGIDSGNMNDLFKRTEQPPVPGGHQQFAPPSRQLETSNHSPPVVPAPVDPTGNLHQHALHPPLEPSVHTTYRPPIGTGLPTTEVGHLPMTPPPGQWADSAVPQESSSKPDLSQPQQFLMHTPPLKHNQAKAAATPDLGFSPIPMEHLLNIAKAAEATTRAEVTTTPAKHVTSTALPILNPGEIEEAPTHTATATVPTPAADAMPLQQKVHELDQHYAFCQAQIQAFQQAAQAHNKPGQLPSNNGRTRQVKTDPGGPNTTEQHATPAPATPLPAESVASSPEKQQPHGAQAQYSASPPGQRLQKVPKSFVGDIHHQPTSAFVGGLDTPVSEGDDFSPVPTEVATDPGDEPPQPQLD